MKPVALEDLTIELIEKVTGLKATEWEGNCYAMACAAAALLDDAEAVYGHWLGGVDPKGYWSEYYGNPIIRHGWVQLSDGRVLDPTRWSFEAETPYLFIGDPEDKYDRGGQQLRIALRTPPPEDDPSNHEHFPDVGDQALAQLNCLLQRKPSKGFSTEQLFWLANAPYNDLHPHAKEFYEALIALDETAISWVPIDHQHWAGL